MIIDVNNLILVSQAVKVSLNQDSNPWMKYCLYVLNITPSINLTGHYFDNPPQSEEDEERHTVPHGVTDRTEGQGKVKAEGHEHDNSVKYLPKRCSVEKYKIQNDNI